MNGEVKFTVTAAAEGEPSGFDSAVIAVPARWHVTVNDGRAFLAQVVGRELREVSEGLAAGIGGRLHHAEWTVTSDPGEVTTLMHDCASCRARLDQALAFMRDNPGREMAVGQLWWAAR